MADSTNTKWIEELSPAKREFLRRLLEQKREKGAATRAPIERRADGPALLSFPQQRMWFLHHWEPDSGFYNVSGAIRLRGSLRLDVLRRALDTIVLRHEALRTTFEMVEGQLVQIIASSMELPLPVEDLSGLSRPEQDARIRQCAVEEAQRPFDLARGPLLRVALLQADEGDHVLLLTMHHIISDGWSLGVFFKELSALYSAFYVGAPSPLSALSLQYADFAVWQRQWLKGEVRDAQLAYWTRKLSGAPSLELSTDRARPVIQRFQGSQCFFRLPVASTTALKALSEREGATLFMTLLAAFQVLLSRYSAAEDICVGSPVAGRRRPEVEELIGLFVNTLVLRTDLSGDPSFLVLLGRVRAMTLEAYDHQDVPFEQVVEALQLPRDLSRTPLFQVMFVLQNAPLPEISLPEVALSLVEIESTTAKFDLMMSIEDAKEGMRGLIEYSTDLFDRVTIERMIGHFHTLLDGIVADPKQPISALPILTEPERHQILTIWNDFAAEHCSQSRCIHELFELQAQRTPEAVAVAFEGHRLTYQELNWKANQLAHRLRSMGVGPDMLVGLCVDRSLEIVIGVLGILKAGGAYVPLDPDSPSERLAFMLEDSGVRVVVTQQALTPRFSAEAAKIICLDADREDIAQVSKEDLRSGVKPENVAYVIYTSGSTGNPKGVLVEHRNVIRLFQRTQEWFHFDDRDVWTLFHSYTFDFSVWEIWGPLLYGGRLVVVPFAISRSPDAFYRLLCEEKVTVLNQTPSAFRNLVLADTPDGVPGLSLRWVIFGGESVDLQSLRPWFERHGDERPQLVNMYGITETTVHVTYRPLRLSDLSAASVSPIGRPIPDLQVYVLDRHQHLVPVGVPGEMYVGGPGVARGYLNRAELTAERFVENPFSEGPKGRLYKTGDLGRWRPDGSLEYLGRIDHQVKIRGFRIELGEVESVLSAHSAVRQATVIVREDVPGDKRLVAYMTLAQASAVESGELRSYLKAKLPEYMIPSAFVQLDVLPLTSNGKVDRRALPAPGGDRPEFDAAFVAPRTAVEELVAVIWTDILKVTRVGAHDDFFALGGHSLLATQLMARLRQSFGVELPLRSLFEAPTVAGVAERIEATRREGAPRSAPPLVRADRTGDLPLSFAQQRLWFLDQMEPDSPLYNTPAAMRLQGPLDRSALEQSLQEIVDRHEALRTKFPAVHGQPRQVIVPELPLPLPVIELRNLPELEREAKARQLTVEEAQQPFNLAEGPLIRTKLLCLDSAEHILLLTMHHIVSDGWSMGVLIQELAVLYEAFSKKQPSPLTELPIQYPDYAVWQRRWLEGGVLEEQLAFWTRQLGGHAAGSESSGRGPLSVLELPTDRPRPAIQTSRGAMKEVRLSRELSDKLRDLSRREGVTLFMTLLAAFQVLLNRYSGQDDIVVGSPIAGRGQAEVEGLIGFFVNALALRTDLSGEPSFLELLRRVREVMLDAYDHQDVPFERLVDVLSPGRDLSRTPLFQVMFALQNTPLPALQLADVRLSPFVVESTVAKYDLLLLLGEVEGTIQGWLEYNIDLFNGTTIERMIGHYKTLIEGIVAAPAERISTLPLLTELERQKIVIEWNDTATDYPSECSIHQLFEEQVARTPEAVAVSYGERRLTYVELNRRANQLAHLLRSKGVGPDVLVGIGVERSIEMVVGLLGILKAGGGYVPLDLTYPADRLAFMMSDTQARVLVASKEWPEARALSDSIIFLDPNEPALVAQSEENPTSGAVATNLAYVIYTSGSTGTPKGVAVTHRGISRLVLNTDYVIFDSSDVVAQISNCSFDAATFEIWGALLHGARLVVIEKEVVLSARDFADRLVAERITALFLTPALFNQIVRECPRAFEPVKHVVLGGDAMDPRWCDVVLRNGAPRRLLNGYGPTETTTFATWHQVTDVPEGATSIPIGRPIANTQVYVLNGQLHPTPVGLPGELYIGGPGLARGYLNRPELTAQRFVPSPFGEPGSRLYKTGDLCRWLPDGCLECMGRLDHQVKLRGFRIELGEIETTLLQQPAVADAVVLMREDTPGDKRLVAYVVLLEGTTIEVSDLREHLEVNLPEYMIPSAIVRLDALPLTPNGKVDRRALAAPDEEVYETGVPFVAPSTPTEEIAAGIWGEILEITRIGIYDNFFALGGHSLRATQVIARLRQSFEIELPLRALFEAPTVAGLAERIDAARHTSASRSAVPLVRADRERELSLSFAQQRLWFLDQMEPNSSLYNIPGAIRLRGPLNQAALEQSLQEIVRRHEALRTTFPATQGRPLQCIATEHSLTLPHVDLRELRPVERDAMARKLAAEEAEQPFDLAQGPLLRAKLLVLDSAEHVLLLTMHHIVSDGWSMGVMVRELAALYEAASKGQPSGLPELPVQYADYALWQRQWLEGGVLEQQLAYWKRQLGGAAAPEPNGRARGPLTVLTLPTDGPRPPIRTARGATKELRLSRELANKLRELSHREGVTLFMTLLAAFQVLLYRYSGQDDIVVGSPIAGRGRFEVEGLIGFFVNTIPLRTDLSGEPSFSELLGRVKEVTLGAYDHQDVPFEKLVDAIAPERDLSRTPIYQVVFALQNAPLPALQFADIELSPFDVESTVSKFDMTLALGEVDEELRGGLEYNTDLFEAATIARMLDHYKMLLEGICVDPAERISSLPLLTEPERRRALVEWNDTAVPSPEDICLHELFEAQAARTPEAIAVVFKDERLTYRQLDQVSNRLGHQLRRLGARPNMLVAVVLEKGWEQIAAVLGIEKSGAAYVPIDPGVPAERFGFLLQHAQVRLAVTESRFSESLAWPEGVERICLDKLVVEPSDDGPLERVQSPEDLAYVIYTSGSTGLPKGVMIDHRGPVNTILDINQRFRVGKDDRVLAISALNFDLSVYDVFGILAAGGMIVLPEAAGARDPAYWSELCEREHVTLWNSVPALVEMLVSYAEGSPGSPLSSLRLVLMSGDWLPVTLPDRLRRLVPGISVTSLGGATEASIWSILYPVDRVDPSWRSIPYGRPMRNQRFYVLSEALEPCPIGVEGGLFIGGVGLAKGYWGDEALTRAAFIEHPRTGERLYRTGDQGRYLADGTIEFLGRKDFQVKIRGFRIELGEIEVTLAGHEAVREAVVLVREDVAGDKRLVAYVVLNEGASAGADELRSYVEGKLPEYMIPSAFMELEGWPLTPNGKIDRRALPAPGVQRSEHSAAFIAPRDVVENDLARIWEETLGVRPVGVQDNFFVLGGHSLLAVQLLARIQERFGKSLPLSALFQDATVERLAHRLQERPGSRPWSPLVAIQPVGTKRPFFCVHPAGGMVVCYAALARHIGFEQPFYAFQARGLDDGGAFHTRLEDMAAEYIEAMRSVQPEGPYLVGGYSFGGAVAFEMAHQLVRAGHRIAGLFIIDTGSETDGEKPPETHLIAASAKLHNIPVSYEELEPLDAEEQMRRVVDVGHKLRALPSGYDVTQLRHMVDRMRTHIEAWQTYVQNLQLYSDRIIFFRAGDKTRIDGVKAPAGVLLDPALGWGKYSSCPIELYEVPGTHEVLMSEPSVLTLAEQLKQCFLNIERSSGTG